MQIFKPMKIIQWFNNKKCLEIKKKSNSEINAKNLSRIFSHKIKEDFVNQNPSMVMAEIQGGHGPMAHQLPLHNHRGGLVQPSLVMNHHHLDMDCHQTGLDINVANISKFSRQN